MTATADSFAELFEGLRLAYGSYRPDEDNGPGKQKGQYRVISEDIDDARLSELWSDHLSGECLSWYSANTRR